MSVSPQLALKTVDQLRPMDLPALPERPLVPVLIANYNYARYIGEAIDSVLAQTYGNFEVCICDDGSKDNSVEVVRSYAFRDPRIKLIVQENGGQGSALNAAWRLAGGQILELLDSDDVFLPSKLAKLVSCYRASAGAGLVVHPVTCVTSDLRVLQRRVPRTINEGWLGPEVLRGIGHRMPTCSGVSLRRQVADRVFPADERFREWADSVVTYRALCVAQVASIDQALALYRIHGRNLSTGLAGPNVADVQRRLLLMQRVCADLAEFALRQRGVKISPEAVGKTVCAENRLAEQLLRGEGIDETLLRSITVGGRARLWRLVFACPRLLGRELLYLYWGQSRKAAFFKWLLVRMFPSVWPVRRSRDHKGPVWDFKLVTRSRSAEYPGSGWSRALVFAGA